MTTMRNVDELATLVAQIFDDIIRTFDMQLIDLSNDLGSEVLLKGTLIEIQFLYDRGELRCLLMNPAFRKGYLLNLIYELLNPRKQDLSISINDSIPVQLTKYSYMLMQNDYYIIKSDFSWRQQYEIQVG